jgi:DNA-binding HxlR family transcriptional regulator
MTKTKDELTETLERLESLGIVFSKYDAKTGKLEYSLTQRGKNSLIYPDDAIRTKE